VRVIVGYGNVTALLFYVHSGNLIGIGTKQYC